MKQLPAGKKKKLLHALKKYHKKYLVGKYAEVDEAATRLMINEFLTEVLGFASLDEIKTEYMIRGTYADYVVQIKEKRYFIVEAKAMSLGLSEKHLRQAVNYAANEGIDWVLLTNGKHFDFYKVLFNKPIESRRVFFIDLSEVTQLKSAVDALQYLTKALITAKGLDCLWNKVSALDPVNFSRLLYSDQIVNNLKRQLKRVYKNKFSSDDIVAAITRVVVEEVESVKPLKHRKSKKKKGAHPSVEQGMVPTGESVVAS